MSYEKSVTEVSICHLDTWMDPSDKLLSHFFFTFLATNDFTGKSWKSLNNYLIDLLNGSSGLKNVAVALAALDRSRMPCSSKMPETEISLKQRALVSYSSSLHGLKSKITNASPTPDWESTVWITFFLGIFEVCIALPPVDLATTLVTSLVDARAFGNQVGNPLPVRHIAPASTAWSTVVSAWQWPRELSHLSDI